ncbi:hypothetical protein A2U01_0032880, partial [Trifolium medium]|nr:hypothetical protein [Trifolium medium]
IWQWKSMNGGRDLGALPWAVFHVEFFREFEEFDKAGGAIITCGFSCRPCVGGSRNV